ncbi:MAG: tRNA uridine-5-carboxymethylaminomethyl(34) synthesis GTPase MnmE [Caulobacterales bacterium]
MSDTIYAPATAPGRAAVAVLRLSGPGVGAAVKALAGRLPAARRASVRRLKGAGGETLDEALVLWFPGPASYTGEDAAELHLHGGTAVVGAVSHALAGLGLRLAEPGEFTRRAFEAGRLDLDQAEAVADLVDAETDAQARQAMDQLQGALGRRYEAWREQLVEALANLEAAVDFPDEELPTEVAERARPHVEQLARELRAALADAARGQSVREGYRIAIVGAPNAGKSSLLNALAGRDAAITAPSPGTTRDIIEATMVLQGYKVLLGDTAGLRATCDPVEAEGVRRARTWAEGAALRLLVIDRSGDAGLSREATEVVRPGDVLVLNKADLPPGDDAGRAAALAANRGVTVVELSALAEPDMKGFRTMLSARVVADLAGADVAPVTRQRHEALLREALEHVERAATNLAAPELAAEDLRLATRALARVTGRIGAEDVLDRVFASFCIGK